MVDCTIVGHSDGDSNRSGKDGRTPGPNNWVTLCHFIGPKRVAHVAHVAHSEISSCPGQHPSRSYPLVVSLKRCCRALSISDKQKVFGARL